MKEQEKNDSQGVVGAILDAYFSMRAPNGSKDMYVEDDKTTRQIMDDLHDTQDIPQSVINEYLHSHGYILKLNEDGTPIWRIFRLK
jgi:hypothetical protein